MERRLTASGPKDITVEADYSAGDRTGTFRLSDDQPPITVPADTPVTFNLTVTNNGSTPPTSPDSCNGGLDVEAFAQIEFVDTASETLCVADGGSGVFTFNFGAIPDLSGQYPSGTDAKMYFSVRGANSGDTINELGIPISIVSGSEEPAPEPPEEPSDRPDTQPPQQTGLSRTQLAAAGLLGIGAIAVLGGD
jgi:hypothetical protein